LAEYKKIDLTKKASVLFAVQLIDKAEDLTNAITIIKLNISPGEIPPKNNKGIIPFFAFREVKEYSWGKE
ncbi:25244_t:CDS:2, partial [Gigaspora margarita]